MPTLSRVPGAALIAVLLALLTTSASARPKKPADPESEARVEAKKHFQAGEEALAAQDWDKAIAEYRAAYELAPLPGFLFNLGQAYRFAGDKRQALDFYKKYLAAAPTGSGAPVAKVQIQELTKAIAADDAARIAHEAEEARKAEEARRAAEAAAANNGKGKGNGKVGPSPSPSPGVGSADRPAPGRRGRGLRIAGLVTAGVGVACLAGGVVFGMKASGLADEVAEQYDPDKVDEGESASSTAVMLYVVGGAAVVGGGVMYFLGRRAGRSSSVAVAPVVTGDRVALAAWGTF